MILNCFLCKGAFHQVGERLREKTRKESQLLGNIKTKKIQVTHFRVDLCVLNFSLISDRNKSLCVCVLSD